LLAKALSTGHGYTLINAPVPGIVPVLYPPAFPWLLSLVYRLGPEFPRNVWLLKSVSIAAMLGAGVVIYGYFTRERALPALLALGIALATVLSPALVFLATSTVMSECVFTLAQLLTIAVIERGARLESGARTRWYAVAGGVLASFTFLVRSISVVLLVAVVLHLLHKRRWRSTLVFTLTVTLAVGPWLLYSRLHTPSDDQSYEGIVVRSYTSLFWRRIGDDSRSGTISLTELPERIWHNTLDIVERRMTIVLVPTTPYVFKQGDDLPPQTNALSLALSALVLAGLVAAARENLTLAEMVVPLSIAGAASWPWDLTRFLVPLTPFLLFYLLVGCRVVTGMVLRAGQSWTTPAQRTISGALLGLLLLSSIYEHAAYLRREYASPPAEQSQWARRFEEHVQMYRWIRDNLPADAVIAAQNPAQVYLFTGRKTIAAERPTENWETWRRLNVRYLARMSFYPLPPIDWADLSYKSIYRSGGELNLRIFDLGPAASSGPPAG